MKAKIEGILATVASILGEVQQPPPLLHLALQRVLEEGLGVEGLPATLQARVAEWPSRRQELARAMVDKFVSLKLQSLL